MKDQEKRNRLSAEYYDHVYGDYHDHYSSEHIHYGLWFDNTKTHEESLVNTIEEVARHLKIQKGDIVLDAGCGSGGACRHLARKHAIHIIGITLSDALLKAAATKSSGLKLKGSLHFLINDYHRTSFREGSFTKAFGIESVCYSEDVPAFAGEMKRILKKDGILVIADFFKKRSRLNVEESIKYRQWLDGWAMPDLLTPDGFKNHLESAGFTPVEYVDTTGLVRKSIDLIHDVSTNRLLEMLVEDGSSSAFIRNHLVSGCRQKELFDNDSITYGIITAIKTG